MVLDVTMRNLDCILMVMATINEFHTGQGQGLIDANEKYEL